MTDTLTIATYNIRTDTHDDGPEGSRFRWASRFPYIKQLINTHSWDIIGIQEAREKQLEDLATLPGYQAVGQKRSSDEEAEYNPILFKTELFELLETQTYWLSPSGEVNSLAEEWDAAYPRIFTLARLKMKETGQTLTVLNTHFDHTSEKARHKSSELIAEKVKALNRDEPLFLTGDFNGERQERFYDTLSYVLRDAELESPHQIGPDVTCTLVTFDYIPKWEDMVKIDYIFINEHVEVIKTETLTDKFNGYYPSDHFPVSLSCRLK